MRQLLLILLLIPFVIGGVLLVDNHSATVASCQAFNRAAAGEILLIQQIRTATATNPTRSAAYKRVADKRYRATLATLEPQDCTAWRW